MKKNICIVCGEPCPDDYLFSPLLVCSVRCTLQRTNEEYLRSLGWLRGPEGDGENSQKRNPRKKESPPPMIQAKRFTFGHRTVAAFTGAAKVGDPIRLDDGTTVFIVRIVYADQTQTLATYASTKEAKQ